MSVHYEEIIASGWFQAWERRKSTSVESVTPYRDRSSHRSRPQADLQEERWRYFNFCPSRSSAKKNICESYGIDTSVPAGSTTPAIGRLQTTKTKNRREKKAGHIWIRLQTGDSIFPRTDPSPWFKLSTCTKQNTTRVLKCSSEKNGGQRMTGQKKKKNASYWKRRFRNGKVLRSCALLPGSTIFTTFAFSGDRVCWARNRACLVKHLEELRKKKHHNY